MKHTNKEMLGKGLRYLAGALPLTLIGPSILYTAFNNKEHPLYIAVLIFGLLACAGAIFLMFKGIGTLMKALFD
ncbi:MAG: DUF6095 family protein [Bacteroidota bacterium]